MARRKKRKGLPSGRNGRGKEEQLFNFAFRNLTSLMNRDEETSREPEKPEMSPNDPESNEARQFQEAMCNVKPLVDTKNRVTPALPSPDIKPPHQASSDELEGLARLSDMVTGTAELDISFSDEYIEGSVQGFSPKLMKRLKHGQFPIQEHLDLHGLTREEAEAELRGFLVRCYRLGLRCVLVVHGRGLNSENHMPVLKELLPVWLKRGPVKQIVLAFSTAKPYDGGTGAIYILLKRRKGLAVGNFGS